MARRWATGRGGSSRPEDAGDAGTAALLRMRAAALGDDDGEIVIGADDADAVHLFFALGTQWDRAGMAGIRTGLRYPSIEPTARGIAVDLTPALFADLQLMERAALAAFTT